ncbi:MULTISPECIES: FAD-binding oxidoreductase [unclassified Bradyrhizobium]|uniref:NAD(P)/FAD-dependent oxidoreductase n=1 Tax=unclassified Bradyrhizobium TaxID=2631580 RepID=UPI001FF8DEC6|nr:MULTISPECIES: FAD-binding oxidoreductase [unclassified Bradyrhizobium]MCK1290517.1 FAD-binding oxidoreductase [Bradyrhizobium sp. 30]MCK1351626.1 FAD-binding oxidoreductase [Bradyrhizobium sp. CW7]MCK1471923.1 FAD-binding oxidoreductase [Bradyrhizobium sp. CW10]MCK1507045.1 FAD-binding oxidoreductase [Bradyrhizobium sp. 18]MCK1684655.1 FAD-binding oxidoreductase [Bradyrhizobium sp. 145]
MRNNSASHGLWALTAPSAPDTVPLASDTAADVIVIGAGYTGLSSALHLAEGGARVAVLEASEIGFGGSGRNVGLVNAGMWVMPDTLPDTLGAPFGERLIEQLGRGPQKVFDLIQKHGIECEVERAGTLHCAVGRKGLQEIEARAEQWQKRGAPVVVLNAEETRRKVGGGEYSGALLDKRAGTIQPLAYVHGLARAALAAGARIFTQSEAVTAQHNGLRWRISTESGSVDAEWVIVATDAYGKGLWSQVRQEQIHLPYFNFATGSLPDGLMKSILPERQGAWDTREVLSSFRLDRSGRLVFGSVGALEGIGASVHRAWAQRSLRKLFPGLQDVEFETGWFGMIGMTSNNLPRFHELDRNVVAFSGYNGRGIAPGTVFGSVLASYVLGQIAENDLPLPVTAVERQRFRAAREAFYIAGSQLVHLMETRF